MGNSPFNNPFASGNTQTQEAPADQNLASPFGAPDADEFSFDATGVEAGGFVITPGTYAARVQDLENGNSRKGDPMWTWTFEIVGNPDGTASKFNGKTVKNFTTLTEQAMFKVVESVEALGVAKGGGPGKFKKQDVINRMCYIDITTGEYNGNKTNNVQKVHPYNPVGAKYQSGSVGI